MGEKQIIHQKWQKAITLEELEVDDKSHWSVTR
jgi:hypothetical protein